MREEGKGKREEGRGKREEGRGKREKGRGKREEGRMVYCLGCLALDKMVLGFYNIIYNKRKEKRYAN